MSKKRNLDAVLESPNKKTKREDPSEKRCSECSKVKILEGHFVPSNAQRYRLEIDEEKLSLGLKLHSGRYSVILKRENAEGCKWLIDSDRSSLKDLLDGGREVFLIENDDIPPNKIAKAPVEWLWMLGRLFPEKPTVLFAAIVWAFGLDALEKKNLEKTFGALFDYFLEDFTTVPCRILMDSKRPVACYLLFDDGQYPPAKEKCRGVYRLGEKTFAKIRFCMECTPSCRGRIISENELFKTHGCCFLEETWETERSGFFFLGVKIPLTGVLFHPPTLSRGLNLVNTDKILLFLELLSSAIHLEIFQVQQGKHLAHHKRVASGKDRTDLIPKSNTDPLPTLLQCDLEGLSDVSEWLGSKFTIEEEKAFFFALSRLAMIKYWAGFSALNLSQNPISWCLTVSRLYFSNGRSDSWFYYNGKVKREAIPYTIHNKLPPNMDVPIFDHKMLEYVEFPLETEERCDHGNVPRDLALLCWNLLEYKTKNRDWSEMMDVFVSAFESFYVKCLGDEWWNRLYHPLTLQNAFIFAASPDNVKNVREGDVKVQLFRSSSSLGKTVWPVFRRGSCRRVFKHHPNVPKTITDLVYLDDVQGIGLDTWEEQYLLMLSLPLDVMLQNFATPIKNYCLLRLKKTEYQKRFLFPEFIVCLGILDGDRNVSYREITSDDAELLLVNTSCISCKVRF